MYLVHCINENMFLCGRCPWKLCFLALILPRAQIGTVSGSPYSEEVLPSLPGGLDWYGPAWVQAGGLCSIMLAAFDCGHTKRCSVPRGPVTIPKYEESGHEMMVPVVVGESFHRGQRSLEAPIIGPLLWRKIHGTGWVLFDGSAPYDGGNLFGCGKNAEGHAYQKFPRLGSHVPLRMFTVPPVVTQWEFMKPPVLVSWCKANPHIPLCSTRTPQGKEAVGEDSIALKIKKNEL